MKISVFGLGYVGCVSAACLAREGHNVIGVDISSVKVDMINSGKCPIVEREIDEIIYNAVKTDEYSPGSLTAATDSLRSVLDTDLSIICVGTPSNDNGSLKLDYIRRCAGQIGEALKKKDSFHVIVARSTMLPGSVEEVIAKEIEYKSGKRLGIDFGAVMNPEFLRESTSVKDFYNPAMTVIGESDERSGKVVREMYHFLKAPFVRTDIRTAEMIKYANNSFHGLKVAFANEIGTICKSLGIDSHKVMEIFCMDDRLNLSPYYLKPGFAFGGSCLPKDLRAITYKAKERDLSVSVLNAILESNKNHIQRVIDSILQRRKRRIGLLGLSFKAGTDDLRESPMVILVETLLGKGLDIKIYDKNVSLARLHGANKEYIEKEIPHISTLMTDKIEEVLDHGEIIIVGNNSEEFKAVLDSDTSDKVIYDLVRLSKNLVSLPSGYEGICW